MIDNTFPFSLWEKVAGEARRMRELPEALGA